jgi:hypothetical protein
VEAVPTAIANLSLKCMIMIHLLGVYGSIVVKALCYNPEGHGLKTQ